MAKRKKPPAPPPEVWPKVIETFRRLGDYETHQYKQDTPSVGNGEVRVRRYRMTLEKVDEPLDVLIERLQRLWDWSDNHHDYMPLMGMAKELGVVLEGDRGAAYRKSKGVNY